MEKAILCFALGAGFIFTPALALIINSILKRRLMNIEGLYIGIHCLIGLASMMAGISFMGRFIH